VEQLPIHNLEFSAEWEARIYAIVATLASNRQVEWPEFQSRVQHMEKLCLSDHGSSQQLVNFDLWLRAIRELLQESGVTLR
jgi:hypothetical protein